MLTPTPAPANPCPVCGSQLVQTNDYMDHTLVEAEEKCPSCTYLYRFSYGHYEEYIGTLELGWSYNETPEAYEIRKAERTEAITAAKAKRLTTETKP